MLALPGPDLWRDAPEVPVRGVQHSCAGCAGRTHARLAPALRGTRATIAAAAPVVHGSEVDGAVGRVKEKDAEEGGGAGEEHEDK